MQFILVHLDTADLATIVPDKNTDVVNTPMMFNLSDVESVEGNKIYLKDGRNYPIVESAEEIYNKLKND
jgi:hypothetical protein